MQPPFRGAAHEVFLNMHKHNVHEHSVHEHSEGNGAQVMRIESRAVKKLLLLGVGSALMFTMGGIGSAQADSSGAIHKSTAATVGVNQLVSVGGGRCAGCHRAHTAKAEFLLKQAQPGLCYTCHGGAGSVLDVVDGTDPNAPVGTSSALRGGGFEFALIDGAGANKTIGAPDASGHASTVATIPVAPTATAVTSRHQIDGVTTGTMWGNGAVSDTVGGALDAGKTGVKLECGSCHDPHGNGNYRILRPVPNDAATSASAAGVTPVVAAVVVAPVAIPDAITKVYTTGNYWSVADRNVPTLAGGVEPIAGATDGYITNVAQWCTTCHTRYLAGSGSYKTPLQNAGGTVTDATFTYRHRSDRTDKDGVGRPNCIQCHVSHGTNVAMTGTAASFTAPNGLVPTTGTSRLLRVDNRGTCEMCHNV
jgi:predicted CXXCH cytochrome family protein